MAVCCHVGPGTELGPSVRAASVLNHTVISAAPEIQYSLWREILYLVFSKKMIHTFF